MFPLTPSPDLPDREPRTVDLFTDEGHRMLDALGSEMARAILTELGDEPATTSELADRVGTSIQNANYHLDRLDEVDLVQVVGTHYSSRGIEMDVYAPAHEPLVLVGGDEETQLAVSDLDGDDGVSGTRSS